MTQNKRRLDHLKAEERYRNFREIAYEIAMEEFPDVEIRGITFNDAVVIADNWKKYQGENSREERGDWEWVKEYPFYQNRPNRFEVSLSKGAFAALCYGQLSKHGTRVRLKPIESTPVRPSPLGIRALPVLSVVAATFANIVGASELWVLDPHPGVQSLYREQGFGGVEIYHGRRVGQRRVL